MADQEQQKGKGKAKAENEESNALGPDNAATAEPDQNPWPRPSPRARPTDNTQRGYNLGLRYGSTIQGMQRGVGFNFLPPPPRSSSIDSSERPDPFEALRFANPASRPAHPPQASGFDTTPSPLVQRPQASITAPSVRTVPVQQLQAPTFTLAPPIQANPQRSYANLLNHHQAQISRFGPGDTREGSYEQYEIEILTQGRREEVPYENIEKVLRRSNVALRHKYGKLKKQGLV